MSYLSSTSDNGSPSFSRISLSSLPSRKTEAGLLDGPYSRTSTLRGRRGRGGDPDEELTYIPGRSLRSFAASTFIGGASRLGGGRSPSPPVLSTSRISVGPLFASRTPRSHLLPEDEESSQEENTILPANNFSRTVDTVQLEQFSDISIVHQIQSDPQQISRISAKVNSYNRTPSIFHSQQQQQQQVLPSSPLSEASHLESSQITVVPNSLHNQFSPQQQPESPPSPTAKLPGLDSISQITTVPLSFHNRITSIPQQQNQLPQSPTGEVPYSPGFEKRLVEEAGRENAQFKFSTFSRPESRVENSTFDADNLPSFHFSSPIASSTPRASSKFYGKGSRSNIFDETILSIYQGQDGEDGEDGDVMVLPGNPVPVPQEEAEGPMSMGSSSETDNTDNTMRRKEQKERREQRRRRREGTLDPIREVSGGSSFLRAQGNRQATGDVERPASPLPQSAAAVRTQEEAGAGGSDDERRSRIWSTLEGRSNLNSVQKRDTSHPWLSKRRVGEALGDETVRQTSGGTGEKMAMTQEDSTETLDWLKTAGLVTPQVRASKTGVFASSHRPTPQQQPEERRTDSTVLRPTSRLNVLSPAKGKDRTDLYSPRKISLFSTSIADIPDPSGALGTIEKALPLSYSTPEPATPKAQPLVTTEEESTVDITKEMEIAGTPVTVVRRSRRNREASKSPEDIAANESEVRDALRAFSRQASASPSNDHNPPHDALENEGKGKGKDKEESARMARGDSNKENTRPWGAGPTSTTALFQNRYGVAEKLSGVGASRPVYCFGSGGRVAGQEKGKEREEERGGEKEAQAVEGSMNRLENTPRERLRPPTGRETSIANLLSPREEQRQVPDQITIGPSRKPDGGLESLQPGSRLARTGNIFGRVAATSKLGSTSMKEAVAVPPGEQFRANTAQAPTGISARDAAAAAALQRARALESASSSRPKSPPPRPGTPESRKSKAHLYGGSNVLDSPGSDYDFMEDTRVERGLDDLLSARPAQAPKPTVSMENPPAAPFVPAASSSKTSESLQSKVVSQALQPAHGTKAGQTTQAKPPKHFMEFTQATNPLESRKPAQSVEPAPCKQPTQSAQSSPAGAAPQPRRSLRNFLFGRWETQPTPTPDPIPLTQGPQASAEATQSTQSIQTSSHQSDSPQAVQSELPAASRPSRSENALSSTRTSSSAIVSNSTSSGKGKERGIAIDDPTQDSIHDLLANDKDFNSLLFPSSSSTSEYQVSDSRPPHQRLPREPGDSEIEADPRFILRLKDAEIAMLSKMSNKLQTLQLELRSTKRGIEILEKRLVGSDSEKSSTTGTEVDNTGILDETVMEWTAAETEALRRALQELEALEAKRMKEMSIASEPDRGKRARGGGNGWSMKQKLALTMGLLAMTGLTCLLLEVLLLLVTVRVPCRVDTEFTDSVCNLRNLPRWDAMLPVDVGEGLELLPLESPLLGLLWRMLKYPVGLAGKGVRRFEGLGGIPAWIAGYTGWVCRGIWGLVMSGLGSIWELVAAVVAGSWEIIKAWGVLGVSVTRWVWKALWAVLSTFWAILSWGTKFTPSTSVTANSTTSANVPTSNIVSPSTASPSWIGGGGSMVGDEEVATIVANAGEETSVPFVEEEQWWLDYQAEMRIQKEKNGDKDRDGGSGHAQDEVIEHVQEEPWG